MCVVVKTCAKYEEIKKRDRLIKKKEEEKHTKTLSSLFTHTHTSTIMFAATQQIASVAGLKATKVQVRRVASHRRGDDFDTSILPTAFFFVF